MFKFHDHWVGIYPSSSFTISGWRTATILILKLRLRLRLRLRYGCWASMFVPLVIDAALLTIVPVMDLSPPNNLNFPRRCHWVRFLLFVGGEIERFSYGCYISL